MPHLGSWLRTVLVSTDFYGFNPIRRQKARFPQGKLTGLADKKHNNSVFLSKNDQKSAL